MTDQQLKQVLAKMLPEGTFRLRYVLEYTDLAIFWAKTDQLLKDTELLHLCWLVEQELTKRQCQDYTQAMDFENTPSEPCYDYVWHASWQQRTTALAKVKGIEIR